jgi:hypothetical protein
MQFEWKRANINCFRYRIKFKKVKFCLICYGAFTQKSTIVVFIAVANQRWLVWTAKVIQFCK